jgi:amidase
MNAPRCALNLSIPYQKARSLTVQPGNVAVPERADATDPSDPIYLAMLKKEKHFIGECGTESALEHHCCSVLLLPTLCVALQTFAAKAGSLVISVPMGCYPEDTPVLKDPKNGLVDIAPGIP